MVWIYWTIVFLAVIIIIVSAFNNQAVAGWLGMVVGQLLSNNNWRLGALYILAIMFTTGALFAGFGKPLFVSSQDKYFERVEKKDATYQKVNYLLFGKTDNAQTVKERSQHSKKYHSWKHWLVAIAFWLAAFVYTPIAFWDEACDAWDEAKRKIKGKRPSHTVVIQTDASSVGGAATTSTLRDSVFRIISVDALMEFFISFLKNIIKTIKG